MGDVYGRAKAVAVHPYRLKVNPETYTTSKGDLILKVEMELLGRLTNVKDPRYITKHSGHPDYYLITRPNNGQKMFWLM